MLDKFRKRVCASISTNLQIQHTAQPFSIPCAQWCRYEKSETNLLARPASLFLTHLAAVLCVTLFILKYRLKTVKFVTNSICQELFIEN